ncbi:MAG: diguanylate cyclase [Planctomycetes bacterium]|nr:diguanylate cyclase [Planctomycetota bacterium]
MPSLVLIIGIGLTLFFFFWLRSVELRQLQDDLNITSRDRIQDVIEHMEQRKSKLFNFANAFYYAHSDNILKGNVEGFSQTANLFLTSHSDIKKIMLIPRVGDAQRARFESSLRSRDNSPLQITEENNKGMLTRAGPRPEYFPVHSVEPLGENYDYVGFDLSSQPTYRETIDRVCKTGDILCTDRIPLAFGSKDRFGVALFIAVYRGNAFSAEERTKNLFGLVGMVIDIGRTVEISFDKFKDEGIDLYLYDSSDDDNKHLLYYNRSLAPFGVQRHASLSSAGDRITNPPEVGHSVLHFRQEFSVAGRQWTVLAVPTPGFLATRRNRLPWSILVMGLLATGLVSFYFITGSRRTAQITQLVARRTSELSAEITERTKAEATIKDANLQLTHWAAKLDRYNRQVTLLSEMSEQLHLCLTSEEAYRVIKQFVKKLFPDESGALYIINASKNFLEAVVTWGDLAIEPVVSPDDCWALRRGQINLVNASHSGVLCRHFAKPAAFSYYMCLPMMAQGETIGILNIRHLKTTSDDSQTRYFEAQKQLATTVVEHISSALANLSLRKKLREQSIRDPLTELFNRRYMEESLERELHRAKRNNLPIGIIMFDIDNFKVFNDTAGHDAGDKVLQALAGLMKAQIREEDIACRFGGEEFILILPDMPLDKVKERAENLRSKAQTLTLSHKDKPLGPITISLGVSVFPLHGATAETLIKSADQAMYRSKESGKNRVMISDVTEPPKDGGQILKPEKIGKHL